MSRTVSFSTVSSRITSSSSRRMSDDRRRCLSDASERVLIVESVAELECFDRLRDELERLRAHDEFAHVFLSHAWLRAGFDRRHRGWEVLVVREADALLAALPLLCGDDGRAGAATARVLRLGGYPYADYNGMLCRRERAQAVCDALAAHLATRDDWDALDFNDVRDPWVDRLVEQLTPAEGSLQRRYAMVCPRMSLPASWSEYLRRRLSRESRESLTRALRRLMRQPGLDVSHGDGGAFERDLRDAVNIWAARWANVTTEDREQIARRLRAAHADGLVRSCVIRIGGEPAAALVGLLDRPRQAFRYYLSGFDERFAHLSPGRCVQALAIRAAIELGLREYDFLRGGEPFKYAFGGRPTYLTHLLLRRRSAKRSAFRSVFRAARRLLPRH
ncbi:MAG: GNAT family N-acetyltransferase [Planctomycetota bacterium]|nr:MAG: GNAT family N-acetyltransferase [Planctomycetota bacterium]